MPESVPGYQTSQVLFVPSPKCQVKESIQQRVFFDTTERFLWVIKYFLDALFILNIVSQFYIGYESQGVVIMDEKLVRNHYLHRWFILDVISILPIEVFALTHPEWNIWEVFPYWRLNRLFKTVQIFRFTMSLRKVPEFNKIHVANIYFFCVITLTLHVFSCFWYLVACTPLHDEKTRNCGGKKSWPSLLTNGPSGVQAAPLGPPDDVTELVFISDGGFMNNFSTFDAYVTSLYWAGITFTTVGYGDVYARNVREIAVSVVLMCTGMILLSGFIMADMSSIITNLEARKGRFYTRLESIKLYLEDIGVAEDIRSWISKFYSYMWHHRKGAVISGLLDDLPFTLHAEISVTAAKVLLKKAHLFDGTGDGFKRSLSMHIHPYTYSAGQILVRYGEVSRTMYYLKHGLVQINLIFRIPRNVTLCAATTCEIYLLHQDDLLSLFPDFPEDGEKVREAANTRLFNSIYPLKDAFNFGIASNPQSVVFHKNIADKLKVFWKKTIKPDSWFKKCWTIFYILCLVIGVTLETWVVLFTQVSEVPGFYSSPSRLLLILLAYTVDIIAVADIIITLRTQIISRDGNLSDLRSIFKNYKESWNVHFDLLAIFPLEIFSFVHKHQVKSWNLLGLLRLNRLLWIRKIYMFFVSMENNPEKNLFLYRALKSAFIVFFSIHFSGGIYYLSGCYYISCDNGTWVDRMGLSISTEPQHYSKSIYWSAATLTSAGYGDVRAYTTLEKIICITIGFLGVFVFNYFVSEIGATLASTNAAREAFQNRIRAVVQFMEAHELSESLQMRVIKYMCLLWNKYKGQAYPEGPFLMKDLSSELQQSVLMTERGQLLSRLPFFSEANPEFIQDLAFASVMYFYPKGEIIQYSDTVSRELFCIRKGICEILSEDLSNIMGTFTPGMYFGELGFLFGKPSVVTVRAKTVCDILITDFERVQSILLKYPTLQNGHFWALCCSGKFMIVRSRAQNSCWASRRGLCSHALFLLLLSLDVEDFGNFPIYAGMKEETVDERLRKTSRIKLIQHRPS
ncbi:CNGA1 protein, partial [Polypterus senegalus]